MSNSLRSGKHALPRPAVCYPPPLPVPPLPPLPIPRGQFYVYVQRAVQLVPPDAYANTISWWW